jgi:hypothetical protein
MYGLIKNKFIFKKLEMRIFGDNINTDQLHSPSKFGINKDALRSDYINSKNKTAEGGRNLLIIAGYNFGIGSSRFSTPLALKNEGVKCVAALSISRIFERNLAAAGIFALTISELKRGAKGSGTIKPSGVESVNNSGIKTADLFDLLKTDRETNAVIDCKSLSACVKIKAGKDDSKMTAAEITIKAGAEIITLTAGMDMFLYGVAASGGMVNYVAND